MTPYSGWECSVCGAGNPVPRKRCRKCGRKKPTDFVIKTFFKQESKSKWVKKRKK